MNIKYLQWDSDFFNKKIGELSPNEAINVPFNLTQDYDLIIIKQIKDFSCEIDGYEKTFEETKVLFEKKLTFDNINEIVIEDTDFQNKPPEDFYDLAYESGKYSRFKLDLNLKNKFQDIYKKWVDNSLNKTFAEKVFYIHSEDTINGFVTLQRDGNTAKPIVRNYGATIGSHTEGSDKYKNITITNNKFENTIGFGSQDGDANLASRMSYPIHLRGIPEDLSTIKVEGNTFNDKVFARTNIGKFVHGIFAVSRELISTTKPEENKPAETKPAEEKPTETKPEDKKPAEPELPIKEPEAPRGKKGDDKGKDNNTGKTDKDNSETGKADKR